MTVNGRSLAAGAAALAFVLASCGSTETGPGGTSDGSDSAPAHATTTSHADVSDSVDVTTNPSPPVPGSPPARSDDQPATPVSDPDDPVTTTTSLVAAETVPETTASTPILGEVPTDLMQAVLADAESRTGRDASVMTVTRSEAVVWNDGSLGCPEPGVFYTQEVIDGYWVELVDGDISLDYRLNSNGAMFLCEHDGPRP